MNSARYLSYLLFLLTPSSVFSSPLPGTDGDGNSNCNWDEDACHRYANSTTGSTWGGLMDDASYPSGCIRIRQPDPADDMVVLNSNIAGVESRDGVAPTCQFSSEVSAGGDPHFLGFFESFSFMGECDLLLLSTPSDGYEDQQNDKIVQIHIRTTIQLDFSYISGIAAMIGSNIIEIKENGSLWINGEVAYSQDLTTAQDGFPFSVTRRFKGKKRKIIVYEIDLYNGLSFEVRANLKNNMLFISTSGSFPYGTTGLLGSPTEPGFFTRDGLFNMVGGDADAYAETWQINPDLDPKLFMDDREPQFPSKCLYPDEQAAKASLRGRKLLYHDGTRTKVTLEAAKVACNDMTGVKRDFCIEDTMRTGDLTLALDEFYH